MDAAVNCQIPADSFASIEDLVIMWRSVTGDEREKAERLLSVVSDSLRHEAWKVGKNLDEMVAKDPTLWRVAKSVVVDVVARVLMTSTDMEPMSQMSQSAGGYTVSGTLLIPGGGIFIKRTELARLGLRRQRIGVVEPYG